MSKETMSRMKKNNSDKKNGKKKHFWSNWSRKKKVIVCCLLSVLLIFAILIGYVLIAFKYNHNNLSGLSSSDLGITADLPDGVINIALFGIDSRDVTRFRGNSDSIMILSINTQENKIKLISIMRDSLVKIDDYGTTKINAAYSYGGPTLAMKTLNQTFDLDIKHYATVNFSGMRKLIDAMGGVEIYVTESERLNANIHLNEQSKAENLEPTFIEKSGLQILNGLQAVSWARIRYVSTADGVSNDFGRTDRQRVVLEQLFNKIITTNKSRYPAIIKSLLPYVETSLSFSDIFSLCPVFLNDPSFEQTRIPFPEYVINADFRATGSSTVYYNLDYASQILYSFIYDNVTPEEFIETNGINKTPWYNVSSYKPSTNYKSSSKNTSSASSGTTSSNKKQSSTTSSNTSASSNSDVSSSVEISSSVPTSSLEPPIESSTIESSLESSTSEPQNSE